MHPALGAVLDPAPGARPRIRAGSPPAGRGACRPIRSDSACPGRLAGSLRRSAATRSAAVGRLVTEPLLVSTSGFGGSTGAGVGVGGAAGGLARRGLRWLRLQRVRRAVRLHNRRLVGRRCLSRRGLNRWRLMRRSRRIGGRGLCHGDRRHDEHPAQQQAKQRRRHRNGHTTCVPSGGAPGQAPRDQMAGQLLASAVASDNRGNMCCRQSAARTKLRTKQSSQNHRMKMTGSSPVMTTADRCVR